MSFCRMTSRTPIGLDIGGRHVKAVQLERVRGKSQWRLTAAVCFARQTPGQPTDSAELRSIADILERRGFVGNRFVVPVPAEYLIGGVLDVPARTAAVPVEQIARMELARTTRCRPTSFEMGCWYLPASNRANRKPQVMAVGCTHQEANGLLEKFDSQRLDVVALDVRSCALARVTAPICSTENSLFAILDLGWGSAMVVMMYGGAIVFARSLADAGTRSLHESLHSRLGLDTDVADYLLNDPGAAADTSPRHEIDPPAEAKNLLSAYIDSLLQELKVSFSYVTHEYPDTPLSGLLLSGSNAGMPRLATRLGDALGVEARVIAPPQLVECPPALLENGSSPSLTAAVGLAQFKPEDQPCGV